MIRASITDALFYTPNYLKQNDQDSQNPNKTPNLEP